MLVCSRSPIPGHLVKTFWRCWKTGVTAFGSQACRSTRRPPSRVSRSSRSGTHCGGRTRVPPRGVQSAAQAAPEPKEGQDKAQVVLNELINDGRRCSRPTSTGISGTSWRPTAMPSPEPPPDSRSRATAQRALDGFLARVEEINANPMAGWGVRKVVLFGSFLDPSIERVGDVDLAVEMVPLRQLTKEQFDAVMRRWIHGRRRVQPGEPHAAVRGDAVPQEQKWVLKLLELDGEHVVSTGQVGYT